MVDKQNPKEIIAFNKGYLHGLKAADIFMDKLSFTLLSVQADDENKKRRIEEAIHAMASLRAGLATLRGTVKTEPFTEIVGDEL